MALRQTPLVLVHGFTGAPESFDELRSRLRTYDQHRVYAPCLPGHASGFEPMEAPATRTAFLRGAAAVARTLRDSGFGASKPAVLLGYSLGARLALPLLLQHPSWFRAAVLVGVNPGLQSDEERLLRRRSDELKAECLERDGLETFFGTWEREPLFATQRQLPSSVQERQARVRRKHSARGLAHSLRHQGLSQMPNYWPRLGQLTVPLQLVVGEHDAKFLLVARAMLDALPNATLTIVPQVGHNVVLEAPAALASLLDAFPATIVP